MALLKKLAPVWLILINGIIVGYFSLKITGRQLPTDFVRPMLVSVLSWWAIYLLLKVRFGKLSLLCLLAITVFQVVMAISYSYYQSIDSFFTGDDVVAIAQSNLEELYDFAEHYLFNFSNALYGGALLALSLFTFLVLKAFAKHHKVKYKKTAVISALVFMIAAVVITSQLRQVKYYRLMVNDLQNKIAAFHELTSKIENASVSNATKELQGELYVLIIGESLCRDNMGLYNHSIDNTPFLSKLGAQANSVVFNNAYSSFVNTVPSITASFSQGNIHTGLTFPEGENLISMAKKSGIKTHWISNQVKNGNADTPIGAISSLADESFFTTNFVFDGSYSQKPDMVLIPELEKLSKSLNSAENNLVIIHIMGNHSPYYNRFPEDYPQIKINNPAQVGQLVHDAELVSSAFNGATRYDQYLTAVKYNDDFLSKVYDIFGKRSDFHALVYYSDHAEAVHYVGLKDDKDRKTPVGRHNVAQFSYVMSRIPFIVNVSESFKAKYQDSFASMVANKDKILTNDTLYDFMLDLMQVQSEAINYKFSAANPSFDMGPVDQIKLLENKQVSLDPEYIANVTALEPVAKRLFIKSANALFKANGLLAKGYYGLHVDTVVDDDVLYVKALAKFDDDFLSLEQYLQALTNQNVSVLVSLDKNVSFELIKDYVSDSRVSFMVSSKEQYKLLLAQGVTNLVLQVSDSDLEGLALANYAQISVDLDTFKSKQEQLLPWIANESKFLFISSDNLSVQEQQSVNSLKSLPERVRAIVKYDNAFNSDF